MKLFVAAFFLALCVIFFGSRAIDTDRKACEQRGGVQVKVYSGFKCIKAAELETEANQ